MCQRVDGVSEDYDKLKHSMEPDPMAVGWVHNKEQDEHVEQEDVGAITMNTVRMGVAVTGT